jgi:hypothetical protein
MRQDRWPAPDQDAQSNLEAILFKAFSKRNEIAVRRLFYWCKSEPQPANETITLVEVQLRTLSQGVVCSVTDLPKSHGFACPRCKTIMDEVVKIAPLAGEPGLIGYECPACCYVTSVLLPPKAPDGQKRRAARHAFRS